MCVNNDIFRAFNYQSFTKSSVILRIEYHNTDDIVLQRIPLKKKVRKKYEKRKIIDL